MNYLRGLIFWPEAPVPIPRDGPATQITPQMYTSEARLLLSAQRALARDAHVTPRIHSRKNIVFQAIHQRRNLLNSSPPPNTHIPEVAAHLNHLLRQVVQPPIVCESNLGSTELMTRNRRRFRHFLQGEACLSSFVRNAQGRALTLNNLGA